MAELSNSEELIEVEVVTESNNDDIRKTTEIMNVTDGDQTIDIEAVEESIDIDIIETVDVIDVAKEETYTVESDHAFPALGEPNEQLRHPLMTGRELEDQHPITAITGLRSELDEIESLKSVYSDKRNKADYFLWEDENILQEDRVGLFVSLCEDANTIKLSTTDDDIFGVTVDGAGFIGGQDSISRDISYGLVVHSGIVPVRCESDIQIGDYVITNNYGFAQKTDNVGGYKVIAINNVNGVPHAVVALGDSTSRIHSLASDVDALTTRVDNNETNIVAAINVATKAHNLAVNIERVAADATQKSEDALSKSESAVEKVEQTEVDVSAAKESAAQARAIAESAMVSAETIRKEAVETANSAVANVNDLIKELEPLTTWEDGETGNTGAEYLATYIKDGLATKEEVHTVETTTNDNMMAIEKNAESFRTLVSSIDKYSVGEYSQSYGLTREQATSILKEGMVYVPTKHSDGYSHSEIFVDETEPQYFTPGAYYEWGINDQGVYDWIEHGNSVAFFSEEPAPTRALKYWYMDSDSAPEKYEPYALYKYDGDKWVKVNIFYNNPGNRMTSSISQEVDNISLEITNARGSYAGLNARLEADNEAQVAMVASVVGEDGKVTAASIINAVNNDKSSVTINGDHIILNGAMTNGEGTFSVSKEGHMIVTGGGEIAGWNIGSDRLFKQVKRDWGNGIEQITIELSSSGRISCLELESYGATIYTGSMEQLNIKDGIEWFSYESPFKWIDITKPVDFLNADRYGKIESYCGFKAYAYPEYPYTAEGEAISRQAPYLELTGGGSETSLGYYGAFTSSLSYGWDGITNKIINISTTQNKDDSYGSGQINIKGNTNIDAQFRVSYDNTKLNITNSGGVLDGNWEWNGLIVESKTIGDGATVRYQHIRSQDETVPLYIGQYDTENYLYGTWHCDSLQVENIDDKITAHNGFEIYGGDSNNKYADDRCCLRISGKYDQLEGGWYQTLGEFSYGNMKKDYNGNIKDPYLKIFEDFNGEIVISKFVIKCDEASTSSQFTTSSDSRLKNTVSSFTDSYETLFDNLKPVTFKYNDGQSNRLHSGFIAQEVVEAIESAGLTTKDFAAACQENPNDPDSYWGIRYGEIVSLNTWQIQKLKARVAELERKIEELGE